MMGKAKKGRQFEIETCRQLSLWWSHDKDDDVFWHTHTSGARATVRGKKGKKTKGQCGDVAANDHKGKPLIDLLCMELKRGYTYHHINDCLDRTKQTPQQKLEAWFEQAMASAELAGSYTWALLHRRTYREAMIYFPTVFFDALEKAGVKELREPPFAQFAFDLKCKGRPNERVHVTCLSLKNFLEYVSPELIKKLAHKLQ